MGQLKDKFVLWRLSDTPHSQAGHISALATGRENLRDSLPAVLSLNLQETLTGPWIEGSMRYAARALATGGPSTHATLARLAEILFTEAIRVYVTTLPPEQQSWFAGLRYLSASCCTRQPRAAAIARARTPTGLQT